MNTKEFSNELDAIYKINGLPYELDEYEKSLLLTEAQETLVTGLYNGTLKNIGLEETEELRRYLDDIITEESLSPNTESKDKAYRFTLPYDTLFIIYEEAQAKEGVNCKDRKGIPVYPARHDEWNKIKNNPFRGPNDNRAIRLDVGNRDIEVIFNHPLESYYIRYLRKPSPIVLVDLPDGLTIDSISRKSECELNPALHRYILRTALQLSIEKNKATQSS